LPLELPHICDIKADVDEPSSAATRQRQARRFCAGHAEQRTNTVSVEARFRILGKIDAPQRDERRHRGVDVHRRGAVQPKIDLFFVLILLCEHTARGAGHHARQEAHDKRQLEHPHRH
jgi:hypothetical protein